MSLMVCRTLVKKLKSSTAPMLRYPYGSTKKGKGMPFSPSRASPLETECNTFTEIIAPSIANIPLPRAEPTPVVKKREDFISWEEYFMAVAFLSARRSKDPSSQVGACIVNEDKKIVGIGYNGMPNGISDDEMPWNREGPLLETKYAYVCHAEMNAIMNKNSSDLKKCTIYIALFPCNECAKLIIQAGIKEVVFMSDKYASQDVFQASKRLLTMAGVKLRQFVPRERRVVLDFAAIDPHLFDDEHNA